MSIGSWVDGRFGVTLKATVSDVPDSPTVTYWPLARPRPVSSAVSSSPASWSTVNEVGAAAASALAAATKSGAKSSTLPSEIPSSGTCCASSPVVESSVSALPRSVIACDTCAKVSCATVTTPSSAEVSAVQPVRLNRLLPELSVMAALASNPSRAVVAAS